mgnify:CR=1 FL=1
MKHKVREPFFLLRAFNFLLGIVILAMILAVIFLEWNKYKKDFFERKVLKKAAYLLDSIEPCNLLKETRKKLKNRLK